MLGRVLNRRMAVAAGVGRRTCSTGVNGHPPRSEHCIPRSQLSDPNNVLPWPGTERFRELAAQSQLLQAAQAMNNNNNTTPTSFGNDNSNNSSFGAGMGGNTDGYGGHAATQQQQQQQQTMAQTQQTTTQHSGGLNGINGHQAAAVSTPPVQETAPVQQFVQYVTDYGVPYYHNTTANETVWELPAGAKAICSQTGQTIGAAATTTTTTQAQETATQAATPVQTETVVAQQQQQQQQQQVVVPQQQVVQAAAAPVDPTALTQAQSQQGWERYDTEDGKAYYYHRPTGTTQWEKPI